MTISLLDGPSAGSVYADLIFVGDCLSLGQSCQYCYCCLVEPLSTKPGIDLLLFVLGCSSAIEESDVQKSLTFCYGDL